MNLNDLKKVLKFRAETVVPIVGIGTTSPGAPLDISNTRGDNVYLRNPSAGDPWNYIGFYNNTNRRWWAGTDNSGNFAITRDNASGNILLSGGNVGIGLPNPTYQLQLSTDSAAKPGTSTWTVASDERLKDIRAPFTRGLDAINGLNAIYFNYKRDNPLELPSEREYVGIKAQDAQKVIPESVGTDEQGYLHVTNDSIIWTAVNAIKELYSKFLDHDAQLAQQARSIASKADKAVVDTKVHQLEAENKAKDQKIKELEQRDAEMKDRIDRIEEMLRSK